MVKIILIGAGVIFLAQVIYSQDCGLASQIPYQGGSFSCLVCHGSVTPSAQDLNAFGLDFQRSGKVWTQTLAHLDSDGDNFNNGYEMNVSDVTGGWNRTKVEPCCDYFISNPGDAKSIPPVVVQGKQPGSSSAPDIKAAPNPFNPKVTIQISIPDKLINLPYQLTFQSLDGKMLQTINSGLSSAVLSVTFDASRFASGTYLVRWQSAGLVLTKKVFLSK
jgi:hypothetical protein